MAPSLGTFEDSPENVWGTKIYKYPEDKFRPTCFMGVYDVRDYWALLRHRGKKAIFWCGSDILNLKNRFLFSEVFKSIVCIRISRIGKSVYMLFSLLYRRIKQNKKRSNKEISYGFSLVLIFCIFFACIKICVCYNCSNNNTYNYESIFICSTFKEEYCKHCENQKYSTN